MAEEVWTLGRLLDWTTRHLGERGAETPRLDAEVLLANVCRCRRIDLYVRHDAVADDDVRSRYRDLIRKRIEGCPVAYLVGRKEFFSLEFEVSPAVLIPRPDTETLVMACLETFRDHPSPELLDVGTGSGNVAIALAKHLPNSRLTAIDRSADALAVARRNAARHGFLERIQFLEGDLLAPLDVAQRFDAILSNPPYVPREDLEKLPVGVRHYEPLMALDGGPGGYEAVERLIADAPRHLRPGGWLMLEIGTAQEARVRQLLTQTGFEASPTIHDHSGHPRVIKARWPGQPATA